MNILSFGHVFKCHVDPLESSVHFWQASVDWGTPFPRVSYIPPSTQILSFPSAEWELSTSLSGFPYFGINRLHLTRRFQVDGSRGFQKLREKVGLLRGAL